MYTHSCEKRYFKQICDIDFSAICAVGGACYNDGKGWIGMGEAGSNVLGDYMSGFTGCYDGGKNRIIGLRGGALFNYVVNARSILSRHYNTPLRLHILPKNQYRKSA